MILNLKISTSPNSPLVSCRSLTDTSARPASFCCMRYPPSQPWNTNIYLYLFSNKPNESWTASASKVCLAAIVLIMRCSLGQQVGMIVIIWQLVQKWTRLQDKCRQNHLRQVHPWPQLLQESPDQTLILLRDRLHLRGLTSLWSQQKIYLTIPWMQCILNKIIC